MLKYVVKKRVFGFDKTRTEKYVAQNVITNSVKFEDLCHEISKVGLVPTGVVKFVLDGLIDTLNINLNKGMSVQLGNFGCFRPGINCKSQDKEEDVNTKCIQRVKIIFTPGGEFREMLGKASLERLCVDGMGKGESKPDDQHNPQPKDDEAPDPMGK